MRIRLLLVALLVIGITGCDRQYFPTSLDGDWEWNPDTHPTHLLGTWNLITIQQDWNEITPTDSVYTFWYPHTVAMMKLEPDGAGQVTVEESATTLGTYPCTWSHWVTLSLHFSIEDQQHIWWSGLASAVGDTLHLYRYTSRYTQDDISYRHDWTYVREEE